jgi:hypothetical protein
MADIQLLLEAERRGILPADKQSLLNEARSRGLIESTLKSVDVKPDGIPNRKPISWGEATTQGAIKAFPSTLSNVWEGIKALPSAIANPVDTVSGLAGLASGSVTSLLPKSAQAKIAQTDLDMWNALPPAAQKALNYVGVNPAGGEQDRQMAKAFFKPYSSAEDFKQTLATNPGRIITDISALATGGASAATKLGLGQTANVLATTAKYTNPLNALSPIAAVTPQPIKNVLSATKEKVAASAGKLATGAVGAIMGKSPENLKQAYGQGKIGGQEFIQNLTGEATADDILSKVKQGISSLQTQKANAYRTAKEGWAADKTPIDFAPIEEAFNREVSTLSEGGHKIIGKEEIPKIDEVKIVLDEWKADPNMHNALGLDALKRRIDAIYPESPKHNQAQRIISATRNAVKDLITEQVPEYASAMTEYEKQNALINDINKALGSSRTADKATAINKVMKVLNENPSAKFKQDLVAILKEKTGVDILPAIAGQNLQEWLPQGVGKISGYGGLAYALSHGAATLPVFAAASPRLMGNAFYKAGQIASGKNKLLEKLTPEQALIASKLGQMTQPQ